MNFENKSKFSYFLSEWNFILFGMWYQITVNYFWCNVLNTILTQFIYYLLMHLQCLFYLQTIIYLVKPCLRSVFNSIRSSTPKQANFVTQIRLENFAWKTLIRCWDIWRSRKRRKTFSIKTVSLTPATWSFTMKTATSTTSIEWKNWSST